MLMEQSCPPLRTVRSSKIVEVYYGFGDASGSAFGDTFQGRGATYFEYGQWATEQSEESSNWRELCNLLDSLEGFASTENLRGSEVFLFTDNSTAEATYWKGTSRSPRLFYLILRLKSLA